ncbi:MAG: NUDIX domain-containing protein [Bacteroidia bacterium]
MYKVFINNHPLFIVKIDAEIAMTPGTLLLRFDPASLDELLNLAHEYRDFFTRTFLLDENPGKAFEQLQKKCKIIEAAGGLVKNAKRELLMIYRSEKWDLPKGKLEKGETPEVAALREVEEECGIGMLKIIKPLTPTFHTYRHHDKIVIKKTYWYEMTCADTKKLTPQREEGITKVKWMGQKEVEKALGNTFFSIVDVITKG